jgi:hypothetical protein
MLLLGADTHEWRGERGWDPSALVFAPGETKRQVFDFAVSGRRRPGLLPNSYEVIGSYGTQRSAVRTLNLVP